MKNDRRSKFSNLSNWKEEAWKKKSGLQRDSNPWPPRYRCDALPTELWSHTLGARSGRYELNKLTSLPMCGFIAQLVEHRTGIAEVTGSNPVEALIFFRLLLSNCLNWKIYCDDHSSLWSTTAVHIWIISYMLHAKENVPNKSSVHLDLLLCSVEIYFKYAIHSYYSGFPKETRARVEISASFFFCSATVCNSLIRMREDFADEHMAWQSHPQSLWSFWPAAGIESSGSNHFRHAP